MKLHYFAYGSNLHPARLRGRIPSAEFVEVAVLPDRALRFCKRSEDGSAKCTLLPALGSRAFGAVYRLDESDKPLLDQVEGLGRGYDEAWQWLPLREGVVRVFHYVAATDYVDHSLQPYHWYKQLVLAGARQHEFPEAYVNGIAQVPSVDDPDPERRARNRELVQRCEGVTAPTADSGPPADAAEPRSEIRNLFAGVSRQLPEELLATLVETDTLRIERIVSQGHASPADGWYDQDRNEWVVLLRGAARLAFDDGQELSMAPGDWLEIPAHRKHRVAWTDPEQESIWLAVHYPQEATRDGAPQALLSAAPKTAPAPLPALAACTTTQTNPARQGIDIANLRLDSILDKTGEIPAAGGSLCFEAARCGKHPWGGIKPPDVYSAANGPLIFCQLPSGRRQASP